MKKEHLDQMLRNHLNDKLVDHKCVLLDGSCNCKWPKEDCKYVSIKKELWPKKTDKS